MSVVVLMYHGIHSSEAELEEMDVEDRPYAVSLDNFRSQLDLLSQRCPVVPGLTTQGSTDTAVMLTFDDGHASSFRHVYPELRRRGWSGTFFVTSGFIGKRPGFCSWKQLHAMAHDGMVIGGHGRTHRFLDGLSPQALAGEIALSRDEIAAHIGKPVHTMSFPGGRYDASVVEACLAAGYRQLFGSRVGSLDPAAIDPTQPVPRLAIRATTTVDQLAALLEPNSASLQRAARMDRIKQVTRTVLGSRSYHLLYRWLAS